MECVSYEISKHYDSWLSKAQGLTRDRVKGKDLLHEVISRVLDRPSEDVVDIVCAGKISSYINRALWLSWHSNTSDYAVKYRKYEQLIDAGDVNDQRQDETWIGAFVDGEYLFSAIDRLNEHDAILLRLYAKPDFNYQELSAQTGIPYPYLRKAIHKAIKRIREYVELQRAAISAAREA